MAEQITKPAEKKVEKKPAVAKTEQKKEVAKVETKAPDVSKNVASSKSQQEISTNADNHKSHQGRDQDHSHEAKPKTEEKKSEDKKPAVAKKEVVKKDEAVARGNDLHASMKQCMYICSFIKRKSVDKAIVDLQDVIKMKRAVPFKGEIPHRSEEGMMSGRYPLNASKLFIPLLKGLKGNIIANQMDPDKARITFASASWASRPSKRGGGRFKRTNVVLKAKDLSNPRGGAPQRSEDARSKRGQRETITEEKK